MPKAKEKKPMEKKPVFEEKNSMQEPQADEPHKEFDMPGDTPQFKDELFDRITEKVEKIKVDSFIQKQVSDLAEDEIKKMKIVLQSEKSLLLSMVDQKIDEKSQKLSEVLTSTINEFKKSKDEIANQEIILGSDRQKMEEVLSHIDSKIDQMEKTKKEITEFLRQEFLVERASVDAMIQAATTKINELEKKSLDRLNEETRQFNEGIKKMEEQFDMTALKKSKESDEKVTKEINDLKTLRDSLNNEIKQKLLELEEIESDISRKIQTRMDQLKIDKEKNPQTNNESEMQGLRNLDTVVKKQNIFSGFSDKLKGLFGKK